MPTQVLQTTQELDQARENFRTNVIPPDILATMDHAADELVRSGVKAKALKEGDRVEDFILIDAHGSPVRLQELLSHGPVVVSFYRGGWCPYCNIELHGLQRVLPQMKELGASLVAISPQLPDNSLSTEEKNNLEFPVLSDVGNVVARRFGIVYEITDELQGVFDKFNNDLRAVNGEEGATELPIPATYILDREGTIRLAFVDEDYTKRLDPETILDTLREMSRER